MRRKIMRKLHYESNPLVAYLNQEKLKPGEFGILAGVSQSTVYEVLRCAVRVLPQSFVDAIEKRSGPGTGAKMREAYGIYRASLRTRLQKGP
ncbi:MAG: hypothetical protein AB9886_02050 [Candidatus Cryosericum sp.]